MALDPSTHFQFFFCMFGIFLILQHPLDSLHKYDGFQYATEKNIILNIDLFYAKYELVYFIIQYTQ